MAPMRDSRSMRIGGFVVLWVLAGTVVVMNRSLQYTIPALGSAAGAETPQTAGAKRVHRISSPEQDPDGTDEKDNMQAQSGRGFAGIACGVAAFSLVFGLVAPSARAFSLPFKDRTPVVRQAFNDWKDEFGSVLGPMSVNNINNGVNGYHRANLSAASPGSLLQLGLPVGGLYWLLTSNKNRSSSGAGWNRGY